MASETRARVVGAPTVQDTSALPVRKQPASSSHETQYSRPPNIADFRVAVRALFMVADDHDNASWIAEQGMKLTGADGFAIAMRRGDVVICERSAGLAPPPGTVVRREGYSADCLRSAQPVYCRDLLNDHPTNSNVAMVRSAMLVPIVRDGESLGLLAAFSLTPDAFEQKHQMWMAATAEVLVEQRFMSDTRKQGSAPIAMKEGEGRKPFHEGRLLVSIDKIQAWFVENRQQAQFWSNVSVAGGVAALLVFLSARFVAMPYWIWLLTAPLAGSAIGAAHYARLLAKRTQDGPFRRNMIGLVLGYAVGILFVIVMGILEANL